MQLRYPEVPARVLAPPQTVSINPALPNTVKPSPSKTAKRDSSLKRYKRIRSSECYVEFLQADTERSKAQTELMKAQTEVFKLKKVQLETCKFAMYHHTSFP